MRLKLAYSLLLVAATVGCKAARQVPGSEVQTAGSGPKALCEGQSIKICQFPNDHELDEAIQLVLGDIQAAEAARKPGTQDLALARVACAEVAYPGNEPAIRAEASKRGTFICLFNSQFTMNVALNRLSTFIEDFETVDETPGYTDEKWVDAQKTNGSLGHNLESQDLEKYMTATKKHLDRRAKSPTIGIKMETEFFDRYIRAKLDKTRGKPTSIFLGVFLPSKDESTDAAAVLKATLGHEIFHSLYFHSAPMQKIVKTYIDAAPPPDVKALKKKLSQKGYAVENTDGKPPSPKQVYMFYNEVQAYLLESGACTDGAFVRYEDDDLDEPLKPVPGHAPMVVKYAAGLRQKLLAASVISPEWAGKWSPDLVTTGCVP